MKQALICCWLIVVSICGASTALAQGDPWLSMDTVPLSPFFPLLTTELDSAQEPDRVVLLESRSLVLVLDRGSGEVHVLNQHYEHHHEAQCIQPAAYFDVPLDDPDKCENGAIKVDRGTLRHPSGIVAVAVQDDIRDRSVTPLVFAISGDGKVHVVIADARTPNPLDYLALDPENGTPLATPLGVALTFGRNVVADYEETTSTLWVADGRRLYSFVFGAAGFGSGRAATNDRLTGPAVDIAIAENLPYVLTKVGIETPGATPIPVTGARLDADDVYLWVSQTVEERVARIDLDTRRRAYKSVPECAGPLAVDPVGRRIYVATTQSVVVFSASIMTAPAFASTPLIHREQGLSPVELAVTATHEIVEIEENDSVRVFFDEESLTNQEAPLLLTNQIFIENPKKDETDEDCDTLYENYGANIAANNRLLEDLPGEFAIAIIPEAAEALAGCVGDEAGDAFQNLWDHEDRHVGVLFHDDDLCHPDNPGYYQMELLGELLRLGTSSKSLTFFSGISPHVDAGCDWVETLLNIAAPPTYLFFGMSITEIPQADPRSKDSYPLDTWSQTRPWWTVDADTAGDDLGYTSGIRMVPGDNLAAFTLSDCHNLFAFECFNNGIAGGFDITAGDVDILRLLLRRAIAVRSSQDDHWSFHWPDFAKWDYTTYDETVGTTPVFNCTQSGDIWTGVSDAPACEAQLMQEFLMDIYLRFETHGLTEWVSPEELGS